MPYQQDDNTRPMNTPLVRRVRTDAPQQPQHARDTTQEGQARHARHASAGHESSRRAHYQAVHQSSYHEKSYDESPYGNRAGRDNPYERENPYGDRAAYVSYTSDGHAHQSRTELARAARRHRTLRAAAIVAVAVVGLVAVVFMLRGRNQAAEPAVVAEPAPAPAVEETPQPTEAELRIEAVRARAAANCTREQPSGLTDPADYAELGRATMEGIEAACGSWEGFDNADAFSLDGRYAYDGEVAPYLLAVNRAANVVTAYALDADGRYTVPYLAMICSTGTYTPIGFYTTSDKYDWLPLFQEVYGQYATRIIDTILFHSVPYYNPNMDDLEYEEYNLLGTAASLGCVRLQVCDVKWIYDNCPSGTPVVIYDDADNPGPMGRPGTIATNVDDTDTASATYRGFDPTDPNAENPWDAAFRSGTAIRSDAAQAEWDDAQADDRWLDTVNPANLLGYSTDADSRG